MGRVERPIRRCLYAFARAVDAESVVQGDVAARMWVYAQERGARSCRVTTHRCASPSAWRATWRATWRANTAASCTCRRTRCPRRPWPPSRRQTRSCDERSRECFEKLARQPLARAAGAPGGRSPSGRRRAGEATWHDGEHVPAEHRPRPAATREVSERTGCRCSGDGTMSRRDDRKPHSSRLRSAHIAERDAEDCRSPGRNGGTCPRACEQSVPHARRKRERSSALDEHWLERHGEERCWSGCRGRGVRLRNSPCRETHTRACGRSAPGPNLARSSRAARAESAAGWYRANRTSSTSGPSQTVRSRECRSYTSRNGHHGAVNCAPVCSLRSTRTAENRSSTRRRENWPSQRTRPPRRSRP